MYKTTENCNYYKSFFESKSEKKPRENFVIIEIRGNSIGIFKTNNIKIPTLNQIPGKKSKFMENFINAYNV